MYRQENNSTRIWIYNSPINSIGTWIFTMLFLQCVFWYFRNGTSSGKQTKSNSFTASDINIDELKHLLESGRSPEYILQNLDTTLDNNKSNPERVQSVVNLPTFVKEKEKVNSLLVFLTKIIIICIWKLLPNADG